MRKKNWVEFDNEPFRNEEFHIQKGIEQLNKINVFSQKKGKKGKIVTVITGLNIDDPIEKKAFFRRLKVFCSTGGKFGDKDIQLQGDLVDKVKDFLRKENFQI